MSNKAICQLKVILLEKYHTNKRFEEKLIKYEPTVSRWCTNDTQQSIDTLSIFAELLDVDILGLLSSTKNVIR